MAICDRVDYFIVFVQFIHVQTYFPRTLIKTQIVHKYHIYNTYHVKVDTCITWMIELINIMHDLQFTLHLTYPGILKIRVSGSD